jgi:hypothetical protein
VCQADIEFVQPNSLSSLGGGEMQANERFSMRIGEYFNVPPRDATNARPQRLHYGLFRSEPRGEFAESASAIGDFRGSVNALDKTSGVPLDGAPNARNLDDVNANGVLCHDLPSAFSLDQLR